ncbi:TPR repeat [Acidisarcina polymorpha]|uniref:TPR repeat n=1 Tax=Acidisarcina polymorpha TaxID=2211140 RepID=A0A2Z5G2C9_9BACT|nr:tetratricopeptide repeat protein [Acidisarcina polymorpha]AXC12974.1 TPR repeat [Acidisarcina polymorpha]
MAFRRMAILSLFAPVLSLGQSSAIEDAQADTIAHKYDDAMRICESLLETNPANQAAVAGEIDAASKAALDLRSQNRMEDALSYLLRANRMIPNEPSLLFDIGILENQMHLNKDADEALHKSFLLKPQDPMTLYAIARVKMDLGLYPDAEAAMRSYLEKRPGDASAHYGLGRILLINLKDDAALKEFQLAIDLQPTQTESYYEIGEISLRANDLDKAETNYQLCLKRDPQHGGALTGMGVIAFRRKQYQQAADFLDRAVHLAPQFQTAHYYDGLTLAKLGRKAEAEAELATASKMAAQENARKDDLRRLAPQ